MLVCARAFSTVLLALCGAVSVLLRPALSPLTPMHSPRPGVRGATRRTEDAHELIHASGCVRECVCVCACARRLPPLCRRHSNGAWAKKTATPTTFTENEDSPIGILSLDRIFTLPLKIITWGSQCFFIRFIRRPPTTTHFKPLVWVGRITLIGLLKRRQSHLGAWCDHNSLTTPITITNQSGDNATATLAAHL